jgi:hypothetical protein
MTGSRNRGERGYQRGRPHTGLHGRNAAPGIKPLDRREYGKYRHPGVTLNHELSRATITSTITSPLFDDHTTVAKYGDKLALPNGRYDLGLPPPFGPGAPPGTTFNVVVVLAH